MTSERYHQSQKSTLWPIAATRTLIALCASMLACQGEIGEVDNAVGLPELGPARQRCEGEAMPVEVELRRLTAPQHRRAIGEVFLGHVIADSTPLPTVDSDTDTGFSHEPNQNLIADEASLLSVVRAAEEMAEQIPGVLDEIVDCPSRDASCVDVYLDTVGRRAFRRPLNDEERVRFAAVYESAAEEGASYEDAMAIMSAALMLAPQFLYVPEIGSGDEEFRILSGYERATRLALLLWDGVPDDALLDAAAAGELDTSEGLATWAGRMLDDDRSIHLAERFFREWIGVETVFPVDRDRERFPEYTDARVASMDEAFTRLVHAALQDGWTLTELLTSPRYLLDEELAGMFDEESVEGWEWRDVAPERAVGIFTHPYAMTSLAHPEATSYVHRGLFVFEGLLCDHIVVPPGLDINSESSAIRESLSENPTQREISDATRENRVCGSCHNFIDPAGLAFEDFDASGQWSDRGLDTSGVRDGQPFDTPRELMQGLAEDTKVHECFETQWFRYFSARIEGQESVGDACAIEQIGEARERSVREIVLALVRSEAFSGRRISPEQE